MGVTLATYCRPGSICGTVTDVSDVVVSTSTRPELLSVTFTV